MSCSLTTTSSAPIRSMTESSTRAPAADDVDPARVHRRDRGTLCVGGGQQPLGDLADPVAGDPGVVDGLGVVLREVLGDRRDGGHRSGEPDERTGLAQRHGLLGEVERRLDVGADRLDLLRGRMGH